MTRRPSRSTRTATPFPATPLCRSGERASLVGWALGTAVLTSLGSGALTRGSRLKQDTAIGIVFAGMFALGIALISTIRSYAVDLSHFLFGKIGRAHV